MQIEKQIHDLIWKVDISVCQLEDDMSHMDRRGLVDDIRDKLREIDKIVKEA